MSYSQIIVIKIGEYNQGENCLDNCYPACKFRKEDRCKLYSCRECGELLDRTSPIIRIVFKATDTMETRRQYLYGKGIIREPKEVESFVSYHIDCYKLQHNRWIEEQVRRLNNAPT